MTALAAAADRAMKSPGDIQSYKVKAAKTIYKSALVNVEQSGGFAQPATDTSGEQCVGVAVETSTLVSGESDGDRSVKVYRTGRFLFTASSITQAMVGDLMYVVDDNTIDDAAGPTNDIAVGVLVQYVSNTSGWVDISRRAAD